MIVNYLNIVGMVIFPRKDNPPLLIDSYTVLAFPVAL